MEGSATTDPFLWDADAVATELCTLSRPCTHDPDDLAAKVRQNEIDGHVLLTYDLVGLVNAHDLRNELFETLSIKAIKHKHALGEAIMGFRLRSPAFRQWKSNNLDSDATGSQNNDSHRQGCVGLTPVNPQSAQPQDRDEHDRSLNKISSVAGPSSGTVKHDSPMQPLKKRRVTAELIQSEPLNHLPVPIATEAETVSGLFVPQSIDKPDKRYPWDNEDVSCYLGNGSFVLKDITSPQGVMTSQVKEEGGALRTPVPTHFPRGRRLVIDRIMRRLLNRNNQILYGAEPATDLIKARELSSEPDEILDITDLPLDLDDLDQETLREMEVEAAEVEAATVRRSRTVPQERVRLLLGEETALQVASWRERKLPRYEARAYHLWLNASRQGTKTHRVLEARSRAKWYNERLQKLEAEIVGQTWEKEKDVRFQAKCLQQTVEDKSYQNWLADTLASRFPPSKPTSSKKRPAGQPRIEQKDSDDELLTSSEEENFIVDDEDPITPGGHVVTPHKASLRATEQGTPGPYQFDSHDYIDLTQLESSNPSSPARVTSTAIDDVQAHHPADSTMVKKDVEDHKPQLSSVPQVESQSQLQPSSWPDKYRDIEEIVSKPPSFWSKEKDRYSLTITLLWRLKHSRRSAIFRLFQDKPAAELFDSTIMKHVSDPVRDLERLSRPGPETLAFDVTRLFLCFLRMKNLKESRLADLKPSQIAKLKAQRGQSSWAVFHNFSSQVAPFFPKDNQIYCEDALDGEVLSDEVPDEGAVGEPSSLRKTQPKEIVRNREAVDIRERETRRAEEQEARRQRLRTKLDDVTSIPTDKSRLIINESKLDGQPLIYVNEIIGGSIKHHQMEGVRFMWNQITEDQVNRQGCLLAHAMGLGKTMQVITLLIAIRESSNSSNPGVVAQVPVDLRSARILIICPPSLVDNWWEEFPKWDKQSVLGDVETINSSLSQEERSNTVTKWSQNSGVLVVGYTMMVKLAEWSDQQRRLLVTAPSLVIVDEAHNMKNPDTKIRDICTEFRTTTRIAMTGSPLANNIEEYFFMIDWVAPNFLGPLHEFRSVFANPIQRGLDTGSSGTEKRHALKKLHFLKKTVEPKVHRRTIKDCLSSDMPPKQEFVLFLRPKTLQARFYDQYLQALQGTVDDSQASKFAIACNLVLLCNHPACAIMKGQKPGSVGEKSSSLPRSLVFEMSRVYGAEWRDPSLSAKVEVLVQILDFARGVQDKVLIFTQSKPTLDYLSKLLSEQDRSFCRLDGTTPMNKRQDHIKKFNEDDREIYLISTKAGGQGLNIQGANRVVIFDRLWNPQHEQQAIARAFRIGQLKPVTVYHLVTAGTLEQVLHDRSVFKSQLASRVVDKKNPISWGSRTGQLLQSVQEAKQDDLKKLLGKEASLDKLIAFSDKIDVITKVISTDTFEQEDDGALLSAEEIKETNNFTMNRNMDARENVRPQEIGTRRHRPSVPQMSQGNGLPAPTVAPSSVQTMDGAYDDPTPVTADVQPLPQAQPLMEPRTSFHVRFCPSKRCSLHVNNSSFEEAGAVTASSQAHGRGANLLRQRCTQHIKHSGGLGISG